MTSQRELWLVEAERMRRLRRRLAQLASRAQQILAETEVVAQEMAKIEVEFGSDLGYIPLGSLNSPFVEAFSRGISEEKFEIGHFSYADVVDRLVPANTFSLDEAWDTIRDKIVTDTNRARDGLRQSLDRDDRFQRIDDDREGIWYLRVDTAQARMSLDERSRAPVYARNGY